MLVGGRTRVHTPGSILLFKKLTFGGKRSSYALLVGMQTGAVTKEDSAEVPQKAKNRISYNIAIALLSIYLKK